MQIKKFLLAARHWHQTCIIPSTEHKHPPVADLSTPQASDWRVMTNLSTTATASPLFEILAEGKKKISVELCVFGPA
jgi:hypothetical protein